MVRECAKNDKNFEVKYEQERAILHMTCPFLCSTHLEIIDDNIRNYYYSSTPLLSCRNGKHYILAAFNAEIIRVRFSTEAVISRNNAIRIWNFNFWLPLLREFSDDLSVELRTIQNVTMVNGSYGIHKLWDQIGFQLCSLIMDTDD